MFELKPISAGAIPAALAKAERYRLLNEPEAAESICLDILEVEPEHQGALVNLLLARTDRFNETMASGLLKAKEVLPRLHDRFARANYEGVMHERHATALLRSGRPGTAGWPTRRSGPRWSTTNGPSGCVPATVTRPPSAGTPAPGS